MRIGERVRPDLAHLIHFDDAQAIRDEIAQAVPAYEGIQHLKKAGDQVQWGGERLCEERAANGNRVASFPTADGRAKFSAIELGQPARDGRLRLSTRRGKQFNSMVHRDRDPLTGARRDDLLISRFDADRLGVTTGDRVLVRGLAGQMQVSIRVAAIAPGNVQAHWPEANVLIERGVSDPECGIPDFNTTVEIEKV
jgi:predicted molibdopterin-dependent oxidoreductase YjgC